VAIRVPTPNVSAVDLKFVAKRATSKEEINGAVKRAAEQQVTGILGYTDRPMSRLISTTTRDPNRMIDTAMAKGKLI
jgi:glyceraldehyde-3-phosphate dehydrogenase/erythrose-4-phosphate dehydrogenase